MSEYLGMEVVSAGEKFSFFCLTVSGDLNHQGFGGQDIP